MLLAAGHGNKLVIWSCSRVTDGMGASRKWSNSACRCVSVEAHNWPYTLMMTAMGGHHQCAVGGLFCWRHWLGQADSCMTNGESAVWSHIPGSSSISQRMSELPPATLSEKIHHSRRPVLMPTSSKLVVSGRHLIDSLGTVIHYLTTSVLTSCTSSLMTRLHLTTLLLCQMLNRHSKSCWLAVSFGNSHHKPKPLWFSRSKHCQTSRVLWTHFQHGCWRLTWSC